jgi:hypothetical protein
MLTLICPLKWAEVERVEKHVKKGRVYFVLFTEGKVYLSHESFRPGAEARRARKLPSIATMRIA